MDSMTGAVGDLRGRWAIWFVAAAGAIAYAIVFYPGAMSFDSAYQWWQARGGESTNIQGIGMIWLWRADNAVAPGPGAIFMLQLLLFWGGIALIAQYLSASTPMRLAFMLVVAAAPVCFVLLSHVWSDVMLMCVLTCAVAAILHARGRRRPWLLPAYALLFLAVTLRHNAAAAVFPLLVYMEYLRTVDTDRAVGKPMRTMGIALFVAFIFQFATAMLERTVDQPRTMFAATAQWDLAAISLDVSEILLPSKTHGPGLTLDDLRQAFEPFTNTSLFARTRAGMMQPYLAPADPLNGEIRRAWIDAVLAHPREYLAHRWRLTRALFGSKSRDWPYGLVYFDGAYQFDGNPPVTPNTTSAHAWCLRLFDAIRDSVLLSTWPYLCLGLVALALAWRRRHRADRGPAFAVLASGLLYAAPLPLVAPAAELRYTGWICLAALLGAALVLAPPRLFRPRAQPPVLAS
jgi:hypothetical protein